MSLLSTYIKTVAEVTCCNSKVLHKGNKVTTRTQASHPAGSCMVQYTLTFTPHPHPALSHTFKYNQSHPHPLPHSITPSPSPYAQSHPHCRLSHTLTLTHTHTGLSSGPGTYFSHSSYMLMEALLGLFT